MRISASFSTLVLILWLCQHALSMPPLSSWKHTEVMAETILVYDDIQGATQVNGIPWSLLQERSQPCNLTCMNALIARMNNATTPEDKNWWAMEIQTRSESGYVAAGEDLRAVLQSSWEVVHTINTTHIELSNHLATLLKNVTSPGVYAYDATKCPNNTLPQKIPQNINISIGQTNGYQVSMFYNQNHTQGPVPPFDDMWACTFGFTNVATGVSIPSLGLGCNTRHPGGIVTWMKQLGFYEGSTSFAMNPQTFYNMLVGQ